ncbi:tetratricopeptide repeat protein [Streptosporangium sp. NPDC050855]|uniref:tetratricopeptide repeat protein n=1 Tax=Streptosporangium sp. NPDC050855 TaxID=3366194 RepID=UPI003790CFF2
MSETVDSTDAAEAAGAVDATGRYAAALRELHQAAGEPTGAMIQRQAAAQVPPLKVTITSWSDWRNGRNVPSDRKVAEWLIAFLRGRARQKSPGYVAPSAAWWEGLRQRALAERRQGSGRGGRPPAPHPPALTPPGAGDEVVRCWVGAVPRAADCFQPREIADRLTEAAADGGTVVVSQVLAGMGGIGKTQLAAAYARQVWQRKEVDVVVWVSAASRLQILAGYVQAAIELGLHTDPDDVEQAARRFLIWAQTTPTAWLMVLDDVQDPADIRELWPSGAAGRVVVTTRRRDAALAGRDRRVVEVGVFTKAEARAYLRTKLAVHGRTDSDAEIDALAADLGYLPLALAQAAAYLIDAHLDCAGYRERLVDRRRTLAEVVPEEGALPDDHPTIVAAAWSLSIDRADCARPAGLARPLLQVAAVLDSHGIPQAALTCTPVLTYLTTQRRPRVTREVSTTDAYDGLRVLHRFSLIDHDPAASFQEVRVHRLIQRATRDTLHVTESTAVAHVAADALMEVWPDVERDQVGPVLRANTASLHALTGTALWEWNDMAHPILFRAATSLGDSGQVHAAIAEYVGLHATATQFLGVDHPDTLDTRNNLASWQGKAGDAAGAVTAFNDLLTDCLQLLGPDHPNTLTTRNNLAHWRGRAGDAAGAAAAFNDLLTDCLPVLGPDHPDTLITRNNLASWRGEAGDAAGAAAAFNDLLTDRLQLLGPDHPDTLRTRSNLASWRGEAGDAAGAAAAFNDLLTDCLQLLGPDHPDTLRTRNNLAHWRGEAGDAAGAAAAFNDLLIDRLRMLGPDHPDTLTTRNNLASWRGQGGDAAGAAAAFNDFLTDCLRVLGPDHPDTLTTRNNLAHWRGQGGDAAGAAAAFNDLLTDCLRMLGPDHPDTLRTRNNLASWRGEAGDAAGAAAAFNDLLTDCLRMLGPDHPRTLTTRNNLAHWRGEVGDAAGAAAAFNDLLTDHLRMLGPDHPDTLTTRHNLAHWQEQAELL